MLDFNVKTIIPWGILTLLLAYVTGLSYYATHRTPPEPAFNFYSQSSLEVVLHGADTTDVIVFGEFNNIFEGDQQRISATARDSNLWELAFEINSPRPARLYLNDLPLEVFLRQDSALRVDAYYVDGELDTLHYRGATAGICRYYAAKQRKFQRNQLAFFRNTRFENDPVRHARLLDSLSTLELAFLLEQATPKHLPDWFIVFEKNEILFQRAYLKLAFAPQEEPFPGYFDEIPLRDEGAVFSYSFYLYAGTLITRMTGPQASVAERLAVADTLLFGETRDVFITRSLLAAWAEGAYEQARALYRTYSPGFSKKKYARFLRMRMELNEIG